MGGYLLQYGIGCGAHTQIDGLDQGGLRYTDDYFFYARGGDVSK